MTQGDILEQIKDIMQQHIGRSNPISSGEIAVQVDLKQEDTHVEPRKYIYEMMKKYNIPVAAGGRGYYIIDNEQELQNYFDSLEGRIEEIKKRKEVVQSAFDSYYND